MAMRTNELQWWRAMAIVWVALAAMRSPASAQTASPPAPSDPFAVLAAKEAQEPSAGGMRVVVQKPDGSPAPDAIVVFMPASDDDTARADREAASRQFPGDEPKRLARLAASGNRHQVDRRGGARVPKYGTVFAFAGDMAAYAWIAADHPGSHLVLPLIAPHTCTVEVTTADGAPAAGVPIAAREAPNQWNQRVGTTGADGTATLRLLSTRPAETLVLLEVVTKGRLQAQLPANGGRLHFQLPKTTAVDATFQGSLVPGAVLEFRLQCSVGAMSAPGDRTGERSARWPFVEIGVPIEVLVRSGRLELAATKTTTRAGSEPLVLERQHREATLALQILDPDGQPARRRSISLGWRRGHDSASYGLLTNAEGWIEVAIPKSLLGPDELTVRVQLRNADGGDQGVGTLTVPPTAGARCEPPPLRCSSLPIVATGRFVTREGAPVANLQLDVFTPPHQRLSTDADGRFVVHGANPEHRVRIQLPQSWCFVEGEPWSCELAGGTENVNLVVQPIARVRFGWDLPPDLTTTITYRLEPAAGEGSTFDLQLAAGQRELLVPPGHWHFVVRHDDRELLRLPDLHTQGGIETHDPRFMQFDWRAFAVAVEIAVRDPDGKPTNACMVSQVHKGRSRGSMPRNGVVHLMLPKDGGRVVIAPNDKMIAKIDLGLVTEDQVVVLGGGPPLTLTLAPMPKLPDGCELVVAIGDDIEVPFDAKGTATVLLPKTGSYVPILGVKRDRSVHRLDWKLPAADVPASGAKVAIEITPARQYSLELVLPRPSQK
jgi:hypothetical protein